MAALARTRQLSLPPNKPMQLAARSFQKEGHCIVQLANPVLRFASGHWLVVAPQLMGRSVRPPRDSLVGR